MSIRDTVTGVQHVGIPTTDLEGTIAYYERLGFECLGIYPNGEDRCTFLPELRGRLHPAHRHLLEQRHPLLQRTGPEPRGHRILPNHVTP